MRAVRIKKLKAKKNSQIDRRAMIASRVGRLTRARQPGRAQTQISFALGEKVSPPGLQKVWLPVGKSCQS
jgi:hypothetical protein